MYLPVAEKIFNFTPVGIEEWVVALLASLGLIFLIEADKAIVNAIKSKS